MTPRRARRRLPGERARTAGPKVRFAGTVRAVQPRIRLHRSFDECAHSYLGYVLRVDGELDGAERGFVVGIGKGAQEKHAFRAGDVVEGAAHAVADPRTEIADLYRASALKVTERAPEPAAEDGPPFHRVPPPLPTYRERGHRRLAARTFATKCATCHWACEMAVDIVTDHWNPSRKRYRRETFCYGPKSCSFYAAGATRKVRGRGGMTHEEEDWVDDDATSGRGPDE